MTNVTQLVMKLLLAWCMFSIWAGETWALGAIRRLNMFDSSLSSMLQDMNPDRLVGEVEEASKYADLGNQYPQEEEEEDIFDTRRINFAREPLIDKQPKLGGLPREITVVLGRQPFLQRLLRDKIGWSKPRHFIWSR